MRSSMDEEDDDVPTCPLCLEELDATDRAVKACQCGYQVCLWCLHTIRERLNGRCPACRTLYDEHNFKFDDFNAEQAAKEAKERKTAKKERERREKLKEIERERARALVLSQQKAKSNLKHARILQRNLVYVIGLSLTLAREEVIRRPDMFGRFGRIIRALVNRSHPFNADAPGGPSISAYVQYARDADALSAVRGMSNAVYDGREIRCAIATTKYCDALLRNAQVSDPAATYHCGNPQCMYYHSTSHSDSVLTREEALARQYGPPPPAHLFVTISSRRLNFAPNNYRSAAAVSSTSQLTAQPANRPFTGRPSPSNPTSSQSLASSPSNHNIPINSPTGTPISGTPPVPANISSPKPVAPSSPPVPVRPIAASMSSSPRHSPPSSPPADHSASRRNRSPIASDSPPAHSSPNVSPPSSLPLPSSATWAAQSNSSVSHSPGRRSRPVVIPRRKAEPPPGFEDPTLARSPANAPSRPPGFDSSPTNTASENSMGTSFNDASSKRVLSSTSDSLSRKPHVSGSPPLIARPPGFGHSPPTVSRPLNSTPSETPTSWLQEASSDAVYPFTQERRPGCPIPEAVPHSFQNSVRDGKDQRSGLEQVLASIGGTLGVSSEIQHMQPPVSMQFEANGVHGTLHNTASSIAESSIPPSHVFHPQPDASFDIEPRNEPTYSKQRVDSFPADLNRVVRTGEVPSSTLPSHTSVPANLSAFTPVNVNINIVRTAIALRGMRSHSRFRFAQGDSADASNGDAQDPRAFGVRLEGNGRQNAVIVDRSDQHHQRDSHQTTDYMDFMGSKKSNASTRQSKSRFGFAEHGSSPSRDSGQVADRVVDSSVYSIMGHNSGALSGTEKHASMVKAAKAHSEIVPVQEAVAHRSEGSDSYIEPSYRQHLMEEKPQPVFTPTKWPPQSISRIPNYETQVEMHQRNTRSMIAGTNVNMVEGLTSVSDVHGSNVRRNVSNVLSIRNDRGIQATGGTVEGLPPPGFRGATSGISPDTTAGDQTSANTGVATKVVPGGTRSEAKVRQTSEIGTEKDGISVVQVVSRDSDKLNENGKDLSIAGGVTMDQMGVTNSSNSVGPASVAANDSDDGRKRSNAQRKRDRKARQARETVGRERKVAKDSYNSNAGGGSSSSASNSTRNTATSNTTNGSGSTSTSDELKKVDASSVITFETKGKNKDNGCKHRSVSDLEREVEEARAIEAQLLDELTKINRRLELYGKDNRVPI